jgi:hypothetical protein
MHNTFTPAQLLCALVAASLTAFGRQAGAHTTPANFPHSLSFSPTTPHPVLLLLLSLPTGFDDIKTLMSDPDLAPVQGPELQALVNK